MQTEWACSNLQFPPPELILFLLWTRGVTLSTADHESAVCGSIKLHLNPKTNKRQAINYADVTRKNPGWVIQGSEVKTHDLKVRVTILIWLGREKSSTFRTKRPLSAKCDHADNNGSMVI